MPVKRLGTVTPPVFDGVSYTDLATSDVTAVSSVICVNKGNVPAKVTIFVEPFDAPGAELARSFICKDLDLEVGQSFETFRFGLAVGDKIKVGSDTPNINFNASAAYEQAGRANIVYQSNQPGFPSVGDIWIDSDDDSVYLYNGSSFATIATIAPTGPTGPTGEAGPQGEVGPTGPEGFGVKVNGTYATLELLEADFPQGTTGDGYLIGENLYVWSALNEEWTDAGPFVGATGPTGATGADSTVTGPTGEQGPIGPTGATGAQGTSITLIGSVPTVGDLPGSGTLNDAYIVLDTNDLYFWDGSQWVNVGPIEGPTGPTGEIGPTGPEGFGIQILASYETEQDFQNANIVGAVGDAYIVGGNIFVFDQNLEAFVDAGQIVGETGATGPTGPESITGPTTPASASATGTAGDIVWDADYIYVCVATDTWKRVSITTWP